MSTTDLYSGVIDLLNLCEEEDLAATAYSIQEADKAEYRICAAGSFSHGKTHLLNMLAGTDVLPESSLPTTTLLTEIRTGTESVFQYSGDDTRPALNGPLSKNELRRFSALGDFADAEGLLSVTVTGNFPEERAVMCDTPGIDDLIERRAQTTFKALEEADAALVTVSAIQPMTLTEKAFVKTYLYDKAVPQIAIVVTFLDKIDEDERDDTLRYIIRVARQWDPGLEVWCTMQVPELADSGCTVFGPDAIRKRLSSWQHDPALASLRRERDMLRLLSLLDICRKRQEILREDLLGDLETRKAALRKARKELEEDDDKWGELLADFRGKANDAADSIKNEISVRFEDLYDQITKEKSLDQKKFVLTDGGNRMQKDIEKLLADKVTEDIVHLRSRMNDLFPGSIDSIDETISISLESGEQFKAPDNMFILQNAFDMYRKFSPKIDSLISKISKGRSTNKNLDFFMNLKNGLDIFLNMMGEDLIRKDTDEQFRSVLDQSTRDIQSSLRKNMSGYYDEWANRIRRERIAWLDRRYQALEATHGVDEAKENISKADMRLNEISDLIQSIKSARTAR